MAIMRAELKRTVGVGAPVAVSQTSPIDVPKMLANVAISSVCPMTRLTISFLLAPSARRRPKSRLFNNTTAHTTVIDTATAVAKENNTDM